MIESLPLDMVLMVIVATLASLGLWMAGSDAPHWLTYLLGTVALAAFWIAAFRMVLL